MARLCQDGTAHRCTKLFQTLNASSSIKYINGNEVDNIVSFMIVYMQHLEALRSDGSLDSGYSQLTVSTNLIRIGTILPGEEYLHYFELIANQGYFLKDDYVMSVSVHSQVQLV